MERERSGAASPEDLRKERFPTTDRRLRVATSSILSAFLFPLPFFLLCSGAVGSRPAAMAEKKSNVDDINEIYESFDNAKMLFMSEVEHILSETLKARKAETVNYEFGQVVEKAYNYSQRFGTFNDQNQMTHLKGDPVNYGFQQHEIALLGNLCPDNLDEALHLIPSLKQHMEDGSDKVEKAIVQVQSFCRH